jgi:hypothetical protein
VRRSIWVAPADEIDFPAAGQVFRISRDTFDHELPVRAVARRPVPRWARRRADTVTPSSESCLRNWMAQADADHGKDDSRLTSAEKRELAELHKANRRLEVENEILKRAAAYFARENFLPHQRALDNT